MRPHPVFAARRQIVCAAWFLAATLATAAAARAEIAPYFRLFLLDGTIVACLGEHVRVEDRVVCSMPVAGPEDTELVSLDAARVDWRRTGEYAAALRAARYADTRGERDFTELSVEVAGMLNEISFARDDARRLAIALEARRRLAEWPRAHHNYRAGDVQQILQLVDEAIADFRAAAGARQFDVNLAAATELPPPVPLLAAPTADESIAAALAVAENTELASERMTLLEAIERSLERPESAVSPSVRASLAPKIATRLERERKIDAAYARLAADAAARARARAAKADVRGVERVLARTRAQVRKLGGERPRRAAAILAAVEHELDAARRLRLARDRWEVKRTALRAYERLVRRPMEELDMMAAGLDDIKRLAGPAAPALERLAAHATAASRALAQVVPPADLASVHSLLVSAAQLAGHAVLVRRDAVASGLMDRAWQASSAAAGALMLLAQAREQLAQALVPPRL